MLVEEIARLTGTLKFNVDARPLITFEKRLKSVMQQLEAFSKIANKKFNIKVALDSKTLRAQLDKAASAKVVIKNFDVDHAGITLLSEKITTKLGNAPVRLSNIRIDIGSLVEQKRLVRTLVEQVKVDLPVKLQFTHATKMLRDWKKNVESAFKVKLDTFVMQSPKIKMSIDREHLHKEIRDALQQIRAETRIKVQLDTRTGGGGTGGGGIGRRAAAAGAFGAGTGIGAAAGGFGRGLIPGLGAAFAVSNLNQISQQIAGQELALTSVTGSKEAAAETKARLEKMGDEIGFDTRSVAASFTKMLASGKGGGFTQEQSEQVFKSMTEFGRVMGLDTEAMKGSLRAVEQMMNKGQIMS